MRFSSDVGKESCVFRIAGLCEYIEGRFRGDSIYLYICAITKLLNVGYARGYIVSFIGF